MTEDYGSTTFHSKALGKPVVYINLPSGHLPSKYQLCHHLGYYSRRYHRDVEVLDGMLSDGATGARDVKSAAWWIHDKLCATGTWADGAPITNWQASMVLADILYADGFKVRAFTWFVTTYLFGCKAARKNGMFRR